MKHGDGQGAGRPSPIMLDVEASGFGRGSYPIEIGLAFPDGTSAERPLPKTPASRTTRIPAYLLRDRARGPGGHRAQPFAIALRPARLSAFLRPE